MDKEKIYEKLSSLIVSALEVDPELIDPYSLIINDLGAESIDILDLSFRIETAFKIKIPSATFSVSPQNIPEGKKAGEILTVQLIVDFIKDKLEETVLITQNSKNV